MDYKEFISYADPGTLVTEWRPESGIVSITMQVCGVSVRALADCDNKGIYAFSIQDDNHIEPALLRLALISQQVRLENLTGEPA
jgi:hypothetical protein